MSFKSSDITIKVDNQEEIIRKVYNVSVGITQYIASGIKVNTLKKNKFYIMVAQNLGIYNLVPLLKKIYSGKGFKNTNYLNIKYAEQVEIQSNHKSIEVEFDGDPAGFLPVRIQLIKKSIDLICL